MHPFTVLVLTLTVCFFSPFLDSLPQLFLKCLLPTCVFRIVHLTSAFFRPLQFNFRLLSFLFLPFRSSRFYLTAVFSMHPFHSHFQDFPVTWYLISHASLHGSLTWLYWWFLFVLPWFAPAAVPQVNPFWIASLGQILGFSFLSSTSALASHYLASVSSVPFLLVLPHSGSTSVRLNFHLVVFLFLQDLISHVFLQDFCTWLSVCFLSLYPVSLPQLIYRWFPCAFAFGTFCFRFTFFRLCSIRFWLLNLLFLPFHSYWCYLTVVRPALDSTFVLAFSSCLQDLISHVFLQDFCTWLSVCFLSLYPDLLPQLLIRWSLKISLLGQILDFHFLSSASVLEPHYSASVSSVPFLLVLPHSGSTSVRLNFHLVVFLFLQDLISHVFHQDSCTWLSVCFLSSFPASLPQLFHRCFPLSTSLRPFLCRDLQLTFNFLSSILVRFKLLSFLTFLFPSSRYPLSAVISMHVSSSVQPVAMPSIRLWYSAHCNSFYRSLFRITVATSVSQLFLTKFSWILLGLRFRRRLLGFRKSSCFRCILAVYLGHSQAAPLYYHRKNTMSTTFLQNFPFFWYFLWFFHLKRLHFD